MKTLEPNELYHTVYGFLKAKGVELKPGSYSQKIQKGCSLLSDAINASQQGLTRAKVEIDKKLDQLRQVIHEKTAPRSATGAKSKTSGESPRTKRAQRSSRRQTKKPNGLSKAPRTR